MKSRHCIDTIAPPTGFGLPPWFQSTLHQIRGWVERSRQRRQLAQLGDAALEDIGLAHADVQLEIEKPFWHL